jgi:hypothetical protein
MDIWSQMITQPGMADLLMLFSAIGIYLVLFARGLNPPADDRLRGLGFFLTVFSMGNILLAVLLNVGLSFQLLEIPYVQSVSTSTTERHGASKPGATKSKLNSESRHRSGKQVSGQEDSSEKTWVTIKMWEGHHSQQTEIFMVPVHRWKIDWIITLQDGSPGQFAVKIYRADGNLVQAITNERGANKGGIFLNRPGRYYLMVSTTQKYKIAVKATNNHG